LCVAKIDLEWADEQYLSTLFKVIREVNKIYTPKKKEKVSASEMAKHIKD
jgi:hypothetical protein